MKELIAEALAEQQSANNVKKKVIDWKALDCDPDKVYFEKKN